MDLTKRYGKARGIERVTFDVARGDVFGFLGPNGAGKTTTMRLLMDFLRPDAGSATVLGESARDAPHAVHARIGYLPTELGFAPRTKVRDHLRFFADARGVAWSRVERLAARLDLDLARPFGALSHGNQQKVGLVQALMHEPELLILDEPTSGLDPIVQREFAALVREAKARGATVFLSSHVLSEVEALCDRVAIIREGRLGRVDTVAAIKANATRRVIATFRGAPPRLPELAGVSGVRAEDHRVSANVRGDVGALVRALASADLVDLHIHEPTLDELFAALFAAEAS
ncbi:MAG: ABC transporter ATP-binding protein [Thermoplasmatota archaeon]